MDRLRADDDDDRSPSTRIDTTGAPASSLAAGTPGTAATAPATPGAVERAAIAAGTRLGRYVVGAPIGTGGMGAVYAAHDPELDRQVAIKVLRGDLSEHATLRLRREARTMAALSHPNLVAVHDVGVVDDRLFLTMELIEGTTLRAWTPGRGWREVLAAYLAAGRGLAAAHAAGVVHRDFKPDNVLRSRAGRIAVGDFGIARRRDGATDADGEPTAAVDVALTQTGAVLGTPIYMAPEQLEGRAADARSDQFAFAVALWEGLFHRHPLVERGADLSALRAAAAAGRVIDPPPGPVPSRVTRALVRALRPDPAARWPSLDALLAELDVLPPRPVRPWAALAAIALLAAGGVGFVWSRGRHARAPAPCGGSDELIAAIWSPARAADTAAAFAASGVAYAADTWSHAEDGIEAWTARWVATRIAVCRATAVHHEQSPAVMDRRMQCLDRQRVELGGLLDALAHPTPTMIENAAGAVSRLDDGARCETLVGAGPITPPRTAAVALAVGQLEPLLDAASSRQALGDSRTARAALDAMAPAVAATADAPTRARFASLRGGTSLELEEYDRARLDLTAALRLTEELGDDLSRAQLTLDLSDAAYAASNLPSARDLADSALAITHRIGDDPALLARIELARANVDVEDNQLDVARAGYERALALLTSERVPPGLSLAVAEGRLANLLDRMGEPADSERHYRASIELFERVLGAEHPKVSVALGNLAALYLEHARVDEAQPLLERSLAIKQRYLGDDHPSLGFAYQNLGVVARRQGRLPDAEGLFDRARACFASNPDYAYALPAALTGLGNVRVMLGRDRDAIPLFEQALAGMVADQKGGTASVADLRFRLARARWRLGEHGRARAYATEAATFYRGAREATEPLADVEAWLRDPDHFKPKFFI